jgi:hypothetical protein
VSTLSAGSWEVDATRLRATLDAIRQTFAQEYVPVRPEALLVNAARVVESIRMVLDELRQHVGQGIVPGVVEEYRPREQAESLTRLLVDLQHGWERRVAVKLGPQKLETLRRLLGRPVPDFLQLLGRERDENTNSSVLAWLLDPRQAPTLALPALCALAEFLDDPATWKRHLTEAAASGCLSVKREYTPAHEWAAEDSTDRLDVVISGPGFVLGLENKVYAREHSGQTEGYARWLTRVSGLPGPSGLYLSPAGLAPASEGFRAVSYMDLLACLLEGATGHAVDSGEEVILASYVKTLAGHVLRTELQAVLNWRAPHEHIE